MINAERIKRDVVVIGASAGGLEPILRILAGLAAFPGTLAIVIHRSPHFESRLPAVLGRRTPLPVIEPAEPLVVEPGRVYTAPRDHHLLFDDGHVVLSRGPKEHRTRPAIDPLFVSAAETFGPRVVGVLLSGQGSDGVSGLIAIKKAGGLSLVQHPAEAAHATMPLSAIHGDDVDAVLPLEAIAPTLIALVQGDAVPGRPSPS